MDELKKTPLYEEHVRLKAQMGPFGGWIMPIYYSGILEEHSRCRKEAAVFDISHMGEFTVKDALGSGIDRAVTQPVERIRPGQGRYGFILNEQGGIIDDLIIFRLEDNSLMLVVNAATVGKDMKVLGERMAPGSLADISSETAKLDIQGPLSREVLENVTGTGLKLPYFGCGYFTVKGRRALIGRTGYTGELGYEIYSDPDTAGFLWRELLKDARVSPAGLGARDILRLEMGYSLYGSDIDEGTTPLEAGLEYFINYDKEFIGREALIRQMKEGFEKKKIAFISDSKRSPRQHYRILSADKDVGEVTSGTYSPMLSAGLGMGYVEKGYEKIGSEITVAGTGGVRINARITGLPFYRNGSLKN
ncbi:MAG: glycine cleavage system aminomethyltransferase GcvT [Elusimicrobia bacterium]|nr:glycine cleavage system aminomethyltransferase GcvT [Elusimicrobiota bacterium]